MRLEDSDERIDIVISLRQDVDPFEDIEGIGVIEMRPPNEDYDYRCGAYFVEETGDRRLSRALSPDGYFWDFPFLALRPRGYIMVETPVNGDIVVYGNFWTPGNRVLLGKAYHIGIYENGRVRSKLGNSHIVSHDVEKVPFNYGNNVAFFRRVS